MQQHVEETRAIWLRTPFAWHDHDCIMATCDHVKRVTGTDPAGPWRGSYYDQKGAEAIYNAYGGVLGLFHFGMTQAGFAQGENRLGAVVVARLGEQQVAGVTMGPMTAFVAPFRGMSECRVPILAAWPL